MKAIHKSYKICGLCFLLLVFTACTNHNVKPAEVRVSNFLASNANILVQIHNENGFSDSMEVKYGEVTSYKTLQTGRYTVEVSSQQKNILKKMYGVGDAGKYTITIAGLLTPETELNEHTTIAKLENITEGAAAHPANGYYPILTLFNDYFVKEEDKGKARVINLLPGAVALDVAFYKDGKEAITFSGLKYPKSGDAKSLKPGNYTLKIKYKGNAFATEFNSQAVEENKLTTFYIISDPESNMPLLVRVVAGE